MCVRDTGLGETKGPSYPLHPDAAPLQGISNKRWLLGQGGAVAIASVQLQREEAWDTHEGPSVCKRTLGPGGWWGPQPRPSSPCSPWGLHAGGRFHSTFLFSLGEHSLSGSSTMRGPVCQPQDLIHPSNSPMGEDIATLLMRRRRVRGYPTCSRLELVQPGGMDTSHG